MTTNLFVALLLPLCDQHGIRVAILQQPVVKLLADGFFLVVQIIYVATPLMRDLEDFPLRLVLGSRGRRLVLDVLHLVGEDEQVIFDVAETLWRGFTLR